MKKLLFSLFAVAVCIFNVSCTVPNKSDTQPTGKSVSIPSDVAAQGTDEAGIKLVELYAILCLDKFPNEDFSTLKEPVLVPMPPGAIRNFLHADPGRGWFYKADSGVYAITIEDPPFHTCAVRRQYAVPPKSLMSWMMFTQIHFANQNRGPMQIAPAVTQRANGYSVNARAMVLPGSDDHVPEQFFHIFTQYDNGSTEIRLTRTVNSPSK